jgi:AAA family ATP:ADP antiporter
MDRLRSFLNLERGEEAPALLLFAYLTLVMSSYMITKAVRDGLFLYKFSAYSLPYVYLGIAAIIGFVVWVYVQFSARVGQAAVISGSLVFLVGNLLLQWWVVRMQWAPATWIFYVWTSIFGIIIVTQVWTVANHVLDLRQAKRLFPLISSGGILGSALGGGIAARLAKLPSVGTDNLILVVIPLLALAGVFAQVLLTRYSHLGTKRRASEKRISFRTAFKTIAKSPYLKLIVALLALSNIVTLVVGIQFGAVVQHAFPGKNQIAAFMGSVSACFSLFAFLLQVLAGSRLVEKFGVRIMLLVLPMALTGGTLVLLAYPLVLWAGVVLKGSDYTLRYSVDRATTELLYLPLPQSTKSEVKAVIDMVMQRLADGVGALLVLFVTLALKGGQVSLCILDLLLLAIWVRTALLARHEYVATVRKMIEREDLSEKIIDELIGKHSIGTVVSMLHSKDPEIILVGMRAAVNMRCPELIPRELLSHSSPKVRDRAIEILSLTENELRAQVQTEGDPSTGASAIIRLATVSNPGHQMTTLSQYLEHPELKVRLSAVVGLGRLQAASGAEKGTVKRALEEITAGLEPDSKQWKDMAEALGDISHPEAVDLHLRLLRHPDPAVKKQAILSAGRAGHRELVQFLVPLLVDSQWAPDTRVALREYGPRILLTLADTFKDPLEDLEVRRSIPLVLAYIPQQASADILLDGLFDVDGLLRYRTIRALGKLRLLDPNLKFDQAKVGLRIREDCQTILWFQQAMAKLYPKDGSNDLLLQLFKDKISRGKDRVFRLLALRLPPAAAIGSLLALAQGDRVTKAAVAEYLDNVLPGKVKGVVLAVIEGKVKPSIQTVRQILEVCLRHPDPILRECAAAAMGKDRWPESGLQPPLT